MVLNGGTEGQEKKRPSGRGRAEKEPMCIAGNKKMGVREKGELVNNKEKGR